MTAVIRGYDLGYPFFFEGLVMKRRMNVRVLLAAGAVGLSTVLTASAGAQVVSTYTGPSGTTAAPTSGNWSVNTNWSPQLTPLSDPTTELDFNGPATGTTYTATNDIGAFTLNTIKLNSAGQLENIGGTNSIAFTSNGVILPQLQQNGVGEFDIASPISLNASNTTFTGSSGGTTGTIGGLVRLTGLITATSTTNTLTYDSIGSGNPEYFPSAANAYAGGTIINGGRLVVVSTSGSGSSITGPFGSGTLTLNGGLIRAATGATRTIANPVILGGNVTFGESNGTNAVAFSGTTTITSTTQTITSSGAQVQFNGIIGDGGNGLGLVKAGTSGSLLLGAANTYSGGTTVSQGTLFVTNTTGSGTGSGSVSIAGAATVSSTLGGTGFVVPSAGNTITASGVSAANGIIAPGNNGVGTLTAGSVATPTTVTFGNFSTFAVDVGNPGSADKLVVNGNLDLSSTSDTVAVSNVAGSTLGGTYTILTYTGTLTGAFNNLTLPTGYTGSLDYSTPGQINLAVTAPEPASAAAIGLTSTVILLVRRRRSHATMLSSDNR
jgi:autotransporter-associated beta strand protein